MRRRLSSLTRSQIDIAGFFILSGVSFSSSQQMGVAFLVIGCLVFLYDSLKEQR